MGKVWTRQPPAGIDIDWSNPLTRGLGFLYAGPHTGGGSGRDLVSGVTGTRLEVTDSDDLKAIVSEKGHILRGSESYTGTDSYYLEFIVPDIAGAGDWFSTVTMVKQRDNATSWQAGMVAYSGVGTADTDIEHLIYFRSSNNFTNYWTADVADSWQGPTLPLDEWAVLGYTREADVSTQGEFYLNGQSVGSLFTAASFSQGTVNRVQLLGDNTYATESCAADMAFAGIWMRELSDAEHKALHDNPWQIFKPQKQFALVDIPEDVRHVPIEKPWTSQPPEGTPLNWGSKYVEDIAMVGVFKGGQMHMVHYGNDRHTAPSSADGIPSADGYALTGGANITWDDATDIAGITPLIGSFLFDFIANGTTPFTAATMFYNILVDLHRLGDDLRFSAGSGVLVTSAIGDPWDEKHHVIGGSWNNDVGQELLFDNLWQESAGTWFSTPFNSSINLLNREDGTRPAEGKISFFYWWNKARPRDVLEELAENPYLMFEPQKIFVPFNEALPDLVTFEKDWDREPS